MRYIFSIVVFLFFHSLAFGKERNPNYVQIDALLAAIKKSNYADSLVVIKSSIRAFKLADKCKDLSKKSLIHQYLGNYYYFSNNLKKASYHYKKSITIATGCGNYQLAHATKVRTAFILSETDPYSAEKSFLQLISEAKQKNYWKNSIEIYNGLGNIYDVRQLRSEALNNYYKALKIAESHKDVYSQAMILNNIGLIKYSNKQVKAAKEDFQTALRLIHGKNEQRLSFNLNNNLGLINNELSNYKLSIGHFRKTLNSALKMGFPLSVGVSYLNLGDSYLKANELQKAQESLDSAKIYFERLNQTEFQGMADILQAVLLDRNGRATKAEMLLKSQCKNTRYTNNQLTALKELAGFYAKQKKFKEAFETTQRYHEIQDSITELQNKDKLAQLQVLYGKERIEAKLRTERDKNNFLLQENHLRQSQFQLVLISAFSLFMLIGVSIILSRLRRKRLEELRFASELIKHVDEERSRIAADLHDDIGQSLSAIKSTLNLFTNQKIDNIDTLESAIGGVIQQTRAISHQLHPSFVAKVGLEQALISLLENTQNYSELITSLDLEIDSPIETTISSELYRISQECINNTIKHAKARSLKISLYYAHGSKKLHYIYQDNGTGFKPSTGNDGLGMMTIRQRVRNLNGKMQLNSSKGFKLEIQIPLAE